MKWFSYLRLQLIDFLSLSDTEKVPEPSNQEPEFSIGSEEANGGDQDPEINLLFLRIFLNHVYSYPAVSGQKKELE